MQSLRSDSLRVKGEKKDAPSRSHMGFLKPWLPGD